MAQTETGHERPAAPLVNERLVLYYLLAALCYFALSLLGGLLMALQLVNHNPLRGIELFSPGRWRMVHTNAIAYGFIANAFLGMLHWAIPRLTLKRVLSVRLSWFIFAAWQVVVVSTAVGLLAGQAQGVEWGETPVWIDPLALVGLPDGPGTPNRRAFALLTYMQWLGSWLDSYPHYHTLDRPGDLP